jgi:signal peptidase I
MNVELGLAFGKRSTKDQWLFGALPWLALSQLAFQEKNLPYLGPRDWTGKKKSFTREWTEALLFAVIAASAIRTFFFEAFTIPTPSMEKSMLVGDYLFVSKMSYGPKVPQTPLAVPFLHNALPFGMTNSYSEAISLPYFRLPGFGSPERLDAVVFNFPHGDTIMVDPFYAGHDYYSYVRKEAIVPAIKRLRLFFCWNRPTRHLFLREEQVLESAFNVESQQTIIGGADAQGRRQRLNPTNASEAASQECFFFKILQDERGNSWAFGIWPFSACQLENGNYPVCVSC